MRLQKMDYGAYESAWKKSGDTIEVDYLKECIRFQASEPVDLRNVVGIHSFRVRCCKVVKRRLLKADKYGDPSYLHVLAVERKNKYGKNVWVFFCDAKELFRSLVKDFAKAFTYETSGEAQIDFTVPPTMDESLKRTHFGSKKYNASHFYEEAVESEGAKLEFLYYLLDCGEGTCDGTIEKCVFAVPGEKKENWCTRIEYPSNTEKCVILDGENLDELEKKISPLLPEKIEVTKSVARVKEEYGEGFAEKKIALEKFLLLGGSDCPSTQIEGVRKEMARWTAWLESGQVEKQLGEEYLEILTEKIKILEERAAALEKAAQARKLEQEKEEKEKNSDNSGERAVEYEISWFSAACKGSLLSIPADCESKYRYHCILLAKPDFIQESQEYDHILVGPGGVLLIETKHWKGTIEIRSDGKWLRYVGEDQKRVGVENPKSQLWRHETLLKAIVPDIAVSSVLCFSNADVIIDGKEYFPDYPIIYVDQLKDHLTRFCEKKLYSEAEVRSIAQIIEAHKVNRMAEP